MRISDWSSDVCSSDLYTVTLANEALASGTADAIAFGRPFIGNPALVERIRHGAEWAADDPQTWYAPGPVGYTDYPALQTPSAVFNPPCGAASGRWQRAARTAVL